MAAMSGEVTVEKLQLIMMTKKKERMGSTWNERLVSGSVHIFSQWLAFLKPWPMRQANSVSTIFGFTSTRSSGRA